MAASIEQFDWTTTPLGVPAAWPSDLQSTVRLMLASRQPMFIAWGPERTLLYNDAYSRMLGGKHPAALGRPFIEVWAEARAELEPLVDRVFGGEAIYMDELRLDLDRAGVPEEAHFAFSYTPMVASDGSVVGLFCAAVETTGAVMARRQADLDRERLKQMFEQGPGFMALLVGPEHRFELANPAYLQLVGKSAVIGRTVAEALPEAVAQGYLEILDEVYRSGQGRSLIGATYAVQLDAGMPADIRHVDLVFQPMRGIDQQVTGILIDGVDVTRIYRKSLAVRESEARFRNMADHAPVMMWVTDPDGRCTYLNRAWYEFTGQEDRAAEGFGWLDATHPDDRALADETFAAANTAHKPFRVEYRLRRADGSYRWAIDAASPRFDGDGAFLGFVGSVIDIDERREAEEALRLSEAKFQAIAASIDQMVWSTLPDGYHDFYNQRWYDFTGVPEGSTDGGAWEGVFHPDDQPRARALWLSCLASGEPYHIEYRLRHRSGEYRWVLGRAQPVRGADGAITRWFGTCTDIAEIVEAREVLAGAREVLEQQVAERTLALESSRARLQASFETSFQLQALVALDGTLLEANRTLLDAIGVDAVDVLGRPFWKTPWFGGTPGLPDQVRGALAVAAQGETTRAEVTVDIAESRRTYDFSVRPIRDGSGAVIAISAEAIDLTDRRNAEAALRQSQKLDAMGQLTGGVAHDFNNLLTPIIGGLDMLQRRGAGEARDQRMIAGALKSAERARVLVQRLLAFARRQPLQPVAVDIAALVAGMAELVASTLGPRIEFIVALDDELPCAVVDPNQLEMAILNLGVNARDAMAERGALSIRAYAETVPEGARLAPGDYVCIAVTDTGTGMDAATLARAVEPFFSTKGIGKGTGLGLSMAHGLAAQSGGALTIESTPGQGTTVSLWLPASHATASDNDAADARRPASAAAATVLLVDDEDMVRASTADMLGELGFSVVEAVTALEALEMIEDGLKFDLLVTDHMMPGMTGVELARALRRERPGFPILIVSGFAETSGLAPDLPRLTKPFRLSELAATVGSLVIEDD